MTVSVRPVPTAFDPPAGHVTLATPTCCCCCCCCCLATTTAFTTFTAAESAYVAGEQSDRWPPPGVAALVGLAAVVVPIVLAVLVADSIFPGLVLALALVTTTTGAYVIAGRSPGRATVTAVVALLLGAVAFATELVLALVTAFVIELATPLAIWAGWAIARARHRRRTATPTTPAGPSWPPEPR